MYYDNRGYLVNNDNKYIHDKLGRKRHINQAGRGLNKSGRPENALYTKQLNLRVDEDMYDRIMKRPKGKRANELRAWIEWGLENDKVD